MRFLYVLLVSALFGATACGGSDATAPTSSPVGTFVLKSMDGLTLPASEVAGNAGPWIVRSSIQFTADGNYSLSQTDSTHTGQASTVTETGKWTKAAANDTVQMTTATAGRVSYAGVLVGATLTRNAYTHVFVFGRQ